jgi:hypothetical protein
METKDIIIFIVISLIVSFGVQIFLGGNNKLGGYVHVVQEDFAQGIKVAGTSFVDSSRNISAGTLSGSDITLTGDATVTDELTSMV